MAQVINTNSLSLLTQNNLNKSQASLNTAIQRLSSGMRINGAKDDAAGQAIANRFTANIKGLTQASRNANDGISLAQTTEGALGEINTNLQRVRELAVQSANGSNSDADKVSIQAEITQRLEEIDRTSKQTDFNGVKVLSSSAGKLSIQIGANDGESISIDLQEISAKTLGLDGFNVNGTGITQNKTATVTDFQAVNAVNSANDWTVTTLHKAATSEQVFAKLNTGDMVTLDDSTAVTTDYTYNAASKSFSYTDTSVSGSSGAGDVATAATAKAAAEAAFLGSTAYTELAASIKPASGSTAASYQFGTNDVVNFNVDAAGKLTIGGQDAYLSAAGELTTNNASGGSAATLDTLTTFVATSVSTATPTLTVNGNKYTGAAVYAGIDGSRAATAALSFTNTISKDALQTKFVTDVVAGTSAITLNSGLLSAKIDFATDGKTSAGAGVTYVDGGGDFTTVQTFDTTYAVNPDTGEATVKSSTAAAGSKYEAKTGATAYIDSKGVLTTEATSKGGLTQDPLKALDAALSKVDVLRGALGAVQNRFDSVISNLGSTITNLSSARSRIEDADYATEVSNMTRANILQQAGTSVLAQANQTTQGVLSLLR